MKPTSRKELSKIVSDLQVQRKKIEDARQRELDVMNDTLYNISVVYDDIDSIICTFIKELELIVPDM